MADEPGAYHFDHYVDGERQLTWTFATMPEPFEMFAANIDYSYVPGRYHMKFLSCSLYQELPRRHLALSNNRFTIRLPDGSKEVTELQFASLGIDAFTSEP